jgi:hypothetical protein
MKTIRDMKRLCLTLLLAVMACIGHAQTSGHIVSGTVKDAMGEMMGVQVCEMDKNNRVIEATITDFNGHFSLRVRNTKDRLRFSFVGYKAVTVPIGSQTSFTVMLESNTTLKEVVVKGKTHVTTTAA